MWCLRCGRDWPSNGCSRRGERVWRKQTRRHVQQASTLGSNRLGATVGNAETAGKGTKLPLTLAPQQPPPDSRRRPKDYSTALPDSFFCADNFILCKNNLAAGETILSFPIHPNNPVAQLGVSSSARFHSFPSLLWSTSSTPTQPRRPLTSFRVHQAIACCLIHFSTVSADAKVLADHKTTEATNSAHLDQRRLAPFHIDISIPFSNNGRQEE